MAGTDWHLPSRWGILRNGNSDDPDAAWHTGRLFDALRVGQMPGDPLLVASDGSGVWMANEIGGPATLSVPAGLSQMSHALHREATAPSTSTPEGRSSGRPTLPSRRLFSAGG
jgi:hypothetical protein